MTALRSTPELLTLQALRLTGFADVDGIADRALLPTEAICSVLDEAARAGVAETMSFAESHGWILTETGRLHLVDLLGAEAAAAGVRELLASVAEAFEGPNDEFVRAVSEWQLRSTAPTAEGHTEADAHAVDELLTQLAALGAALRLVLADLVAVLPRFGRYPAQYDLAVRKARSEGLQWVTGIGILSCHVVWAELHQDLLSTLGRER